MLDAKHGGAEHGFAQVGFELVEDGFAPAGRDVGRDDLRDAADGVAL
ncbi:MAG: hypothetical protein R3C45_17315 [Phycisphaerales bacterium]